MVTVRSLVLVAATGGQFTTEDKPGKLPLRFLGFGDGHGISSGSNDPDRIHTAVD